jgi:PDZ domain-containing protein
MPRVSDTRQLKPIAPLGATAVPPRAAAIVRNVRRGFARSAAALGALAVLAVVTLTLLAAATPSSDYLFLPSPAQPVAPVVKVAGEAPDPAPNGPGFLFTAVAQRRASRLEAWLPFLRDDHAELVPMSALIPPGGTPQEQDQVDRTAMTDSQRTAAAVAEKALGRPVKITTRGVRVDDTAVPGGSPARGAGLQSGDVITSVDGAAVTTLAQLRQLLTGRKVGDVVTLGYLRSGRPSTTKVPLRASPDAGRGGRPILGIGASDDVQITLPVPVTYSIGDVEGPSAGLAFALEVYSALTGRKLAHDRRVAVTGALDINGDVEPIGGAEQKAIGAAQSGAELFLVPTANLAEARKGAPKSLRVIPVKSFADAIAQLDKLPPISTK